jgi:hypothetical protein
MTPRLGRPFAMGAVRWLRQSARRCRRQHGLRRQKTFRQPSATHALTRRSTSPRRSSHHEVVLPPHSSPSNPGPRPSEQELATDEKLAPGLLSHYDDRNPGMHRSATTDMVYLTSRRGVLELDNGSKTEIGAGDVVAQSGTMHRWHNPSAMPRTRRARRSAVDKVSARNCSKTARCRKPIFYASGARLRAAHPGERPATNSSPLVSDA